MEDSDQILDQAFIPELTPQLVAQKLASNGKRFANYVIDLIGFYITLFITGIVFGFLGSILGIGLDDFVTVILWLVAYFGYYTGLEVLFGKTLGKFITKTHVVTVAGKKPESVAVLGRTLYRLIPFEPFSFLGDEAIGWHDSISKTRVISD